MSENKIKTINTVKCPVCDGDMRLAFYAENMECRSCGVEIPIAVIKGYQSRIDRAVEEAVRKEREEMLNIVKSNKKHFMDEYKASMADGEENDSATDMVLACDMILNDIKKHSAT